MRYCFALQVRPDRVDEYVERHRAVWPDMLAALHECGWRNYSLFPPDGRPPGESFELLTEIFHLEDQLSTHRAQLEIEEK